MSTIRGANKSRRRGFKGRRERTETAKKWPPLPSRQPHLRSIRFQGQYARKHGKKTHVGAPVAVPGFACVTAQYPRPGLGLLTQFPFDRSGKARLATDFSHLLGSTNPRPIAVHVEPFPTSVFKVLI